MANNFRLNNVESIEEIISNFYQFNHEITNHIIPLEKTKQFYAWFYLPSENLFAPSKYIKYRNMNYDMYRYFDEFKYCPHTNKEFHGKVSDILKNNWFTIVNRDSQLNEDLVVRLKSFLVTNGYDFAFRNDTKFYQKMNNQFLEE